MGNAEFSFTGNTEHIKGNEKPKHLGGKKLPDRPRHLRGNVGEDGKFPRPAEKKRDPNVPTHPVPNKK